MNGISPAKTAACNITRMRGDPERCFRQWQQEVAQGLLLVEFTVSEAWLEHKRDRLLTALFCQSANALSMTVTDHALYEDGVLFLKQYAIWLERHELLSFRPGSALTLLPKIVTKPWGDEVWYSGVERRGVCEVESGGRRIPLPWLQAAWPTALSGIPAEPLLLVKRLLPSAKPVEGDLYFELHETKYESYVVTSIDPVAWPDGVGHVRLGFCPEKRAAYASDDAFRDAYLASVLAYEAQRRKVDEELALGRLLASEDAAKERELRVEMDQFTHCLPVRVGDAVIVPPHVPHALQHGVQVLEVQTPTYERKILSFAQKVRTQSHWDTREAVPIMRLQSPPQPLPMEVPGPANSLTTRISHCAEFEVLRVVLNAGSEGTFTTENDYCILVVIHGQLSLEGKMFGPNEALLLPRHWKGKLVASECTPQLSLMLARPTG
ncbi:MAG: hypothetical protein AAGF35_10565 [Pseudomonadota bacterium]